MRKILIATAGVVGLMATSAMAQTTAGGGGTASGTIGSTTGSVAGGATAGTADRMVKQNLHRMDRKATDRKERGQPTHKSASTYGSGTVYTDKDHATGGVTASGSADGTGSQSTSTDIGASGSTTADGSTGSVFGSSTADSTNPPR